MDGFYDKNDEEFDKIIGSFQKLLSQAESQSQFREFFLASKASYEEVVKLRDQSRKICEDMITVTSGKDELEKASTPVGEKSRRMGKVSRLQATYNELPARARAIYERVHSQFKTLSFGIFAGRRTDGLHDSITIRSIKVPAPEIRLTPRSRSPMSARYTPRETADVNAIDVLKKARELASRTAQFENLERIKMLEDRLSDLLQKHERLMADETIPNQIDMNRHSRKFARSTQIRVSLELQHQALNDALALLREIETKARSVRKEEGSKVFWENYCAQGSKHTPQRIRSASAGATRRIMSSSYMNTAR